MQSGKRVPPCTPVSPVVSSDLATDTARVRAEIKSLVLNNLHTSPVLSRFYEQILVSQGVNPNEAKILADRYRNFSGVNMSSKSCTHIKVTGVRCDSPALRGEQFCYFHQRMHRGVRTPPQARLHPIALIEDEESIQAALMEVINALMRNTIDLKRAALILRALHIAVKNAGRVKIGAESRSAVTEIPDYAQPTPDQVETDQVETDQVGIDHVGTAHVATGALARQAKAKPSAPAQYSELDIPQSAEPEAPSWRTLLEPPPILTAAERAQKRAEIEAAIADARRNEPPVHIAADGRAHITNHVGTDAFVRPATPMASAATTNTNAVAPNGKGTSSTRADYSTNKATAPAAEGHRSIPATNVDKKKPPLTVKHIPSPKVRKNGTSNLPERSRTRMTRNHSL